MSGLSDDQLSRILDDIETVEDCLARLALARDDTDRPAYRNDPDLQDIVERRFVKMTEAVLDMGAVVVVHERGEQPASNPATMRTLGELDVLGEDLAAKMEAAARFRNVLAHTYGDAIDDVVYDALSDLERYREFVAAIGDYLDSIGALDP